MCTAKLSLLTLVLLILDVLLTAVQGAPVESLWNSRYQNSQKNKKNVIAYRRYVRRRPSSYPDDLYMDEYVEVFHTRLRPPTYWLSDEEVDRIIRCDFNPNLEECKQIPEENPTSTVTPPTVSSTTERTNLNETTTTEIITPDTTATTKRYIEDTTTRKTPTASATTTDTAITTTTVDMPFLPVISEEELKESEENYSETEEFEVVTEKDLDRNSYPVVDEESYKAEYDNDAESAEDQIDNGL